MMNEKEFLESQKDCADMLGMSLEEYEEFCKDVKIPKDIDNENYEYDNSILESLGLTPSDLMTNKS